MHVCSTKSISKAATSSIERHSFSSSANMPRPTSYTLALAATLMRNRSPISSTRFPIAKTASDARKASVGLLISSTTFFVSFLIQKITDRIKVNFAHMILSSVQTRGSSFMNNFGVNCMPCLLW